MDCIMYIYICVCVNLNSTEWGEASTEGVGALTDLTVVVKDLVTVRSEAAEANWADS